MDERTPRKDIYDLVIIGGGPAGLTAGIYAMRAALRTVLVERGLPGGQMSVINRIENYPGFLEISGAELGARLLEHAGQYGLETREMSVVSLEKGENLYTVRLSDDTSLETRAVILATGGKARKLGIPGENEYFGKGVSYCATCDGFFFRDKTVAIVGGGDTALEDALYLAKITRKVYLVHRRNAFRGSRILQERVFAEPAVEIIYDTIAESINGDGKTVGGVSLLNRKTGARRNIELQGVFVLIGFSPDNKLVPEGVGLSREGHVLTDEKCATDVPGIFAIGDLRQKYASQIVTAAADGCTAALAAAHFVESLKESA